MTEFQASSTTGPQRSRPLSPHIQIYRFMLTYVMSGIHRITGAALYFGMILVAWWLIAAASGPNAYGYFEWFIGSLIGRLVLLGYTWDLIHHAVGGIRYLLWDLGYGAERSEREFLALTSIIGSVALTLVVWVVGYLAMGGPR